MSIHLLGIIIAVYLVQIVICCILHMVRQTRNPVGVWDFIKLTFLPYVLYKLFRKEL